MEQEQSESEVRRQMALRLISEAESLVATSPFPATSTVMEAEKSVNGYRAIMLKLREARRIVGEMVLVEEPPEEEGAEQTT